jgi:hypothetical protein
VRVLRGNSSIRVAVKGENTVDGHNITEKAVRRVEAHLARYPSARLQDIYKLLYHACLGPEHAAGVRERAERWLAEEWNALRGGEREDLYEEITLHYPVYRLHLRPAKAAGIQPGDILDAFLTLADTFPTHPRLLKEAWARTAAVIRDKRLVVSDAEHLDAFDAGLRETGFPPMHHSREYAAQYSPAYRLVGKKL